MLYSFTGGTDGANPWAGLVIGSGGVLFGATDLGGAFDSGTVFSLTPPTWPGGAWTEAVLHAFNVGLDGNGPTGNLAINKGGVLFGTTFTGGSFSWGTVFALRP